MQVQQTEYKTVEEEVTRFKCDSCGHVGEQDEMRELQVRGVNPPEGILHQCDECSDMDQPVSLFTALRSDDHKAKLKSFGEMLTWPLALSMFFGPLVASAMAWGMHDTSMGPVFWYTIGMYVINFVGIAVISLLLDHVGIEVWAEP